MKVISCLLFVFVASIAANDTRTVLFHRETHPPTWTRIREAADTEYMRFFIALYQQNTERLEEILYEVSHPASSKYGQHYTYEQILDVVAPPKEHHDAVVNWLVSGGVDPKKIVSRRDSLEVFASVATVEALFHTNMHVFKHNEKGRQIIAHLGEISVPDSIKQYIEMVSGLSLFPPPRKLSSPPTSIDRTQSQTPWIISSYLRSVYNIPNGLRATNPKTTQAAVEFEWPGCFAYSDLVQFQQLVEMPYTNVTTIIPPDQWSNTGCDAESTMDLELMLTIGSGANTFYFTNENWIYEFTQTLMSLPNPPLITSLSWGWMEAQQCDSLLNSVCDQLGVDSKTYVKRTNDELAKAGTMGLSVIVCTQDEGAPSDNNDDCSMDDSDTPVWPIYPSSSPWVTAVGATTLVHGSQRKKSPSHVTEDVSLPPICRQILCNNGTAEQVAMSADQDTLFTSGGGFSNYTTRPSYQDRAVTSYLKINDPARPPASKFGINNRAYPDVSAAGSQTLIVMNGQPQWNGGTSASTPVFAGVVSLLNDWRLNNGKKPLGFLNYILYDMGQRYPSCFHSITSGNNTCTGWQMDTCCRYGYTAYNGWNPATGWGTPNFQEMLKYVKTLP